MASHCYIQFTCTLLFISAAATTSLAQQSFNPKALVLPVFKDRTTLQYVATMSQRTPLVPVKLVVDIGGQFQWVDCHSNYVSTTYRPALCNSAPCSLARSQSCGDCFSAPKPGCNKNTCSAILDNTVTHTATTGELAQDVMSLHSTDGANLGRDVTVSPFMFSCAPSSLLKGLARGVAGMAGLGRTRTSLTSQFASAFGFTRKFAVCLPSGKEKGVIFFGDAPYFFLPDTNVSQLLTYTPLHINPVSTTSAFSQGELSSEYFIGIRRIVVDILEVPIKISLLSINKQGHGGTKVSTVHPYSVLEDSIYKAVSGTYMKVLSTAPYFNMTKTTSVAPFGLCFNSENVTTSDTTGPDVPNVSFDVESNFSLTFFGANSVVKVAKNTMCLAMVNGGKRTRTSIVIGAYQMQDNLYEFDLAKSRFGFSNLLLTYRTACSNFNFTSTD